MLWGIFGRLWWVWGIDTIGRPWHTVGDPGEIGRLNSGYIHVNLMRLRYLRRSFARTHTYTHTHIHTQYSTRTSSQRQHPVAIQYDIWGAPLGYPQYLPWGMICGRQHGVSKIRNYGSDTRPSFGPSCLNHKSRHFNDDLMKGGK